MMVMVIRRGSGPWVAAILLLLGMVQVGGLVGCNVSDSGQEVVDNDDDPPSQNANNDTPGNVNNDEPNNDEPNNQGGEPGEAVGESLFTFCSSAGVSEGEGLRLVHCTGAGDGGAQVAEGDGLRLEAGVFEAVTAQ